MNQTEIFENLKDIVYAYDQDEVFSELRAWVSELITDRILAASLLVLIDECDEDDEDDEMILAVLESELEAYFKTKSKAI